MTDIETDTSKTDLIPKEPDVIVEDEIVDDDPMIIAMKEAEAEIKADEEAKSKEPDALENPDLENPDAPVIKADEGKENNGKVPFIPKPRFDAVLSERDLYRDKVVHLEGRLSVHEQMNANNTALPAKPDDKSEEVPDTEVSAVDEIDAKINDAEAKKLELAKQYDEGEISTVEMKTAEIEIDKGIRDLSKERLIQLSEDQSLQTQQALSNYEVKQIVDDEAKRLQVEHPNVAVIEAQHPAVKTAIWENIAQQAAINLASKGINVNDGSLNTKTLFMREKASITDNYTADKIPELLSGKVTPVTAPLVQQNVSQPKTVSETAINRGKKLDMAQLQPPMVKDAGTTATDGELTDEQVNAMSDDDMADLLEKAPQLVAKIMGQSA